MDFRVLLVCLVAVSWVAVPWVAACETERSDDGDVVGLLEIIDLVPTAVIATNGSDSERADSPAEDGEGRRKPADDKSKENLHKTADVKSEDRHKRAAAKDRFDHRREYHHEYRPDHHEYRREYHHEYRPEHHKYRREYHHEYHHEYRPEHHEYRPEHHRSKRSDFVVMPSVFEPFEDEPEYTDTDTVRAFFPDHFPGDGDKDSDDMKHKLRPKPFDKKHTKSSDKKHPKPSDGNEMGSNAYYVPSYMGEEHQDYKPSEYPSTPNYKPSEYPSTPNYKPSEYSSAPTTPSYGSYRPNESPVHRRPRPTPSPTLPAYGPLRQPKLYKPLMEACLDRPIHERYGGQNYYFSWRDERFNKLLTWVEARNFCRRMCMEAVGLETRSKSDFIKAKIAEDHAYGLVNKTWTSGRICNFKGCDKDDSKDHRSNWFWGSSSTWIPAKGHGFTDWARGKPDDVRDADCLALLPTKHEATKHETKYEPAKYDSMKYRWHDVVCVYEYDVVCEDSEALLKYARMKFKVVV